MNRPCLYDGKRSSIAFMIFPLPHPPESHCKADVLLRRHVTRNKAPWAPPQSPSFPVQQIKASPRQKTSCTQHFFNKHLTCTQISTTKDVEKVFCPPRGELIAHQEDMQKNGSCRTRVDWGEGASQLTVHGQNSDISWKHAAYL
ncbi:hypothetical protein DL89DRAFT_1355 [Linderina pennispora]|uniref:Uncharacterized protein n=1 Tax=Linderina pennispora TaxID=61395 RepID=A0A1Y1WJU7_9FUNG|nr:uncharacterized protein DL89DRAFT_1355 [Linderina pennispora]ORX73625.1 hypothetical protein DL89DRAFT_1355 [Linderina pennispora]